jgi:hypothetical protein
MMRKVFQILTGLAGSIWSSYKKSFISIKKPSVMKQKNIQQEVLVLTQTSFAQNVLIENNGNNKKTYPAEKLEDAFWNGLLNEMLPEIMLPMQERQSELSIWQISAGEYSLLIDMAETPDIVEDSHSINPYFFLSEPKMN